jgi:hypothetical protein
MKKSLFLIGLLLAQVIIWGQVISGGRYFVVNSEAYLKVFNEHTCAYTNIGGLFEDPGSRCTDIAFTPNGTLYGISGSSLFIIDTATGAGFPICDYPPDFLSNFASLTALNDSILLTDARDTLWRINLIDCSLTRVGKIGYSPWSWTSPEGISFPPITVNASDGDIVILERYVYLISKGRLFKIQLDSDELNIISSVKVNPPSIQLPQSFGLEKINRAYDGTLLSSPHLISFDGTNNTIVLIDPATGEFENYCTSTGVDNLIWGSSAEPYYYTDVDTLTPPLDTTVVDTIPPNDSTSVDPPTSINSSAKDSDYLIYPNPATASKFYIRQNGITLKLQRLRVTSMQGVSQIVNVVKVRENEIEVRFSNKASQGVYFVEVTTDQESIRKKIIIRD